MNGKSKLTHQHQEQTEAIEQHRQQAGQDFQTPEQMLQFDAAQNPVPAEVAERLQQSVDQEQLKAPQPWWKRWWNKGASES